MSSHGLAIFTRRPRPLRQYVELEISLPDSTTPISVTAVVARHAERLELSNGTTGPGLGLDLFLFDGRSKREWTQFLENLRAFGISQVAPIPKRDQAALAADLEDTPTFIIKPRDLGRLWAFYRGELAKGRVRIETPVVKPIGTPVELLVVHPTSHAEWVLSGRVGFADTQVRAGQTMIEIMLMNLDSNLKGDFRNFVATGRGMIEEDISMSFAKVSVPPPPPVAVPAIPDPTPTPKQLESLVIDLDDLRDDDLRVDSGLEVPELVGRIGSVLHADEEPTFTPQTPGHDADLIAEGLRRVRDMAARFTATDGEPVAGEVDLPPENPRHLHAGTAEPALPEPPPIAAPSVTNKHPFASFFEEAAAASQLPSRQDAALSGENEAPTGEDEAPTPSLARSLPYSVTSRARPRPPPAPPADLPEDIPVVGRPPVPPAPKPAPSAAEPVPPIVRAAPPAMAPPVPKRDFPVATAPRIPPVVPPVPSPSVPIEPNELFPVLPEADEPLEPMPASAPAPVRVVRGSPVVHEVPPVPRSAPVVPLVRQGLAPAVEPASAQNPPIPPGKMFEPRAASGLQVRPVSQPPRPKPIPAARPALPPSARRKAIRNPVEVTGEVHSLVSTESTYPQVDRDIALARARVIRSPESVTACFRLSSLLLENAERSGLDEAQSALERVIELEPNHPAAHHKLAELLTRTSDFVRAAQHLNKARRLGYGVDPDLEQVIAQGILRG